MAKKVLETKCPHCDSELYIKLEQKKDNDGKDLPLEITPSISKVGKKVTEEKPEEKPNDEFNIFK